jgi:hypothetical protein
VLAQAAEQLEPVHAGHLDVEDGEVGRGGRQRAQRGRPIGIGADMIALLLQQHGHGFQDILVVVYECDGRHDSSPKLPRLI